MALPTRRSYAGAADGCTLTSAISAGDTTATLTGTVTNWPSTGTGPFYMVIDPGLAAEEKILVSAQASGSITAMSRGQDGTTAAAHAAGAVCYPVGAAVDFDEANSALSTMTTKGDLLVTTGSAYARLPVGTNTYALLADSGAANGVAWGQIAAGGIATGAVTSAKILDDTIVNADINSAAAIVDTKLATISTASKVSNSATTATSANTASAIVARDASGNFTAGTVTAALAGNATTATSATNATTSTLQTRNTSSTAIATTSFVNQQATVIAYAYASSPPSDFANTSVDLLTTASGTISGSSNRWTNVVVNLHLVGLTTYAGVVLVSVYDGVNVIYSTYMSPVNTIVGLPYHLNFFYSAAVGTRVWTVKVINDGTAGAPGTVRPTDAVNGATANLNQIFVYDAGPV